MQLQKEMHPDSKLVELERGTNVQWSSKSGFVSKTLQLLDVILETLSEFSEESGQTKQEAEALLLQIQTKKIIFLLVTFGKLFDISDYATKRSQSPSLCVSDCISLIEGLKVSFSKFRLNTHNDFDKVLKLTEELMSKNDITSWYVVSLREKKSQ